MFFMQLLFISLCEPRRRREDNDKMDKTERWEGGEQTDLKEGRVQRRALVNTVTKRET
jgi:hypothetical protein